MQELLSHRGLWARAQCESCGLYGPVARRQLCERLDGATGSASDLTYPHSSRCCATLDKHAWQYLCCWAALCCLWSPLLGNRLFSVWSVRKLHNESFRQCWARVVGGSDPRKTVLARASSTYKRQTRPLVREGAPQKQDSNCQTVIINTWSWAPDGARQQDLLTDRQLQCDFDFDFVESVLSMSYE
jgi:hypothetical protein